MNKELIRKRSGGPQTDEGKKTTSRNALKTGAYSALIVLPGESEEDFKALEEQFILDFSPRDIAEASMVRSLAVLTWKKLRIERLEHAGLIRALNSPFELNEYIDSPIGFGSFETKQIFNFVRTTLPEQRASWTLAFQVASQYQKEGATVKELDGLEINCPLLYDYYREEAKRIGIVDESHHRWPKILLKTPAGKEFDFIPHIAGEFLKEFKDEQWAINHFDSLKATVLDIQEKRLLRFIQHHSAQRVNDDLDRAFYKTLSELRRHQQWRREISAHDITPSEKNDP